MRPIPIAALPLLGAATLLASLGAHAQAATGNTAPVLNVQIQRNTLGSGSPGEEPGGYENAQRVLNDVFHVPQYLPGTPTAATIWPRVIDVPCGRGPAGEILCQGYEWLPKYGRAEYLFFRPVLVAAPAATLQAPPEGPAAAPPQVVLPETRTKPERN